MADDFNDPPPFAGSSGIFLSAAAADETEAARLGTALAGFGLPVLPRPTARERETPAGRERIQRDVQACELFLPLVSVHTNASADGPFRAEWQQAADRAAAKTNSLPFLVPLLAENLSAAAANVPYAFRAASWVPLPGPDAEAVLVARLQEMLRQHESFRLRQQNRQVTPVVVPVFAPEPEAPYTSPPPSPAGVGPRGWALLAAGVVAAGAIGFFAFRRTPVAPAPAAPVAVASATPTPALLAVAASPAEAMRIVIAPAVNLTGDAAIDATARTLDSQLARAFSQVAGFKVDNGAATPDQPAALASARRASAGILVTSALTRTGQTVEIRTQILFAASGVSYGLLGPVQLPAAASEATLTEFVDRATTGVVEASDFLLKPPAQLTKVVYGRPWAPWPLARQIRTIAALPVTDTEQRITRANAILREDGSLLDARLLLARALRDAGRYDEASSAFAEIYGRRALISETELHEVIYDRSIFLGNMTAALSAAREKTAIWPRSGAIDEVVSCLFALNRPGTAATELAAWLASVRSVLSPADLARRETDLAVVTTLAHVRHGETALAQASLTALKNRVGPAGTVSASELEALVFARAGSQADFDRLLDRVSDLGSVPPLTALRLAYNFHGQLLHAGRPDEAAHFLDRAKRFWTARPAGMSNHSDTASLLLEADLNLAQNRPADALAALDRASPQLVASHALDFDGRRALALQDLGRTGDFSTLLGKLENIDLRNSRGLALYWRARLAARAGLQKSAVELLRLAVANGLWFDDLQHFSTSYGRYEPEFATLRGMSGYDELLRTQN